MSQNTKAQVSLNTVSFKTLNTGMLMQEPGLRKATHVSDPGATDIAGNAASSSVCQNTQVSQNMYAQVSLNVVSFSSKQQSPCSMTQVDAEGHSEACKKTTDTEKPVEGADHVCLLFHFCDRIPIAMSS